MKKMLLVIAALATAPFAQAGAKAFCVTVRTKAPHNAEAKVWYHVPAKYDSRRRKPYPVLVYFGGRNCKGKNEASGSLGWSNWADRNGVFLVCPGFRDDEYWEPSKWSGRALMDAIAEIRSLYNIDDAKLCYYGYSAGSQAANLFPAWRPGRCRAWVSHACGVFHEPKATMRGVPGLVTCGDADSGRYVISRAFVEKARRRGMDVIWKSFPNRPHDVPIGSLRLARAFLEHCISGRAGGSAFVGDDQDGVYYPAGSAEADFIAFADRVDLPSRAVADAWGKPAVGASEPAPSAKAARLHVSGVEFVYRIPRQYDPGSRVVVLFGGRGWPGEKTLKAFGFGSLADREKAFLLSPSFSDGEYWNPETGTGRALAAAVAELRKRHGLRSSPLVLYGYSAGGQCAALFAQSKDLSVGAWGAHGCGVYPDGAFAAVAPALVTCGIGDEERLRISRTFAARYREAGGLLMFKPFLGGHELGDGPRAIAEEWIAAVLAGRGALAWGEDDTMQEKGADDIEVDVRNPLYTRRLAKLWQS